MFSQCSGGETDKFISATPRDHHRLSTRSRYLPIVQRSGSKVNFRDAVIRANCFLITKIWRGADVNRLPAQRSGRWRQQLLEYVSTLLRSFPAKPGSASFPSSPILNLHSPLAYRAGGEVGLKRWSLGKRCECDSRRSLKAQPLGRFHHFQHSEWHTFTSFGSQKVLLTGTDTLERKSS